MRERSQRQQFEEEVQNATEIIDEALCQAWFLTPERTVGDFANQLWADAHIRVEKSVSEDNGTAYSQGIAPFRQAMANLKVYVSCEKTLDEYMGVTPTPGK